MHIHYHAYAGRVKHSLFEIVSWTFHSSGFAEPSCADCKDAWMKPISKEALSIGRKALSGTLDRLLKENPAIGPTKEILSYTLDTLEHHIEKKLISRKIFETGESGIGEI